MSVVTEKSWRWYARYHAEYPIQDLFANIEAAFAKPDRILKDDVASTVVHCHPFVIKRANFKTPIHRMRRAFYPTRGQRNWHNACLLQQIGVPSITPIGLIEERWGPLRGRSYFISDFLPGDSALMVFQNQARQSEWAIYAKRIAEIFRQLAQHSVSHRDMNLSNFILTAGKAWLIDLDAMRCHRTAFGAKQGRARERARFLQNCLETPAICPKAYQILAQNLDELW